MTRSKHQSAAVNDIPNLPNVSTFRWESETDRAILSAGAQAMLGMTSPITMNEFFSQVHPEDRVTFEAETITRLEKGGDVTREFRFIRSDGEEKHLIVCSSLKQSADKTQEIVEGIFIDVTNVQLNSKPDNQAQQAMFGSYDLDVQRGRSVWSPALRQMFRNTTGAPVTMDEIHLSVHPDDRDWVAARMQAAMQSPGPYEFTYRIVLDNDTILRVRDVGTAHRASDPSRGQVDRVTGFLTDLTGESMGSDDRIFGNAEFWRLIDSAPIGAYAVDAKLRMVRISKTARAAFAEIDNLLGRDLDQILHILWNEPFASEAVAQFRHTLETGIPFDAEPVIEERADRKVLEAYDWSIERIELDDGQHGVLCYFYDLTERVRNERVIEEQKSRLTLAYDAAQMGAWEVDLRSGKTKGSEQFFRLFGVPDFTGELSDLWLRAVHPDDRENVDEAFKISVKEKSAFEQDFRVNLPQGGIRHIFAKGEILCGADGAPVKVIGVNQDITGRKEIEIALRESEGQMRTVINHTLAFVGVLDAQGLLREVNQPALDFGGLTKNDVFGKPFWDAFWWTHETSVAERCKNAVAEAQAGKTQRFDVVVRGKGDALITIDFLLEPVFDDAGEIQMLVASGFDISAREEARAREKLLMGEINHRTKNVLTLVQAVARQTARGGTEGFIERFEERLGALAKAQDLLFASSVDRVDLHDLAKSQLAHFLDQSETRITLDGPPVSLAPQVAQTIGMALHELATNAGKYGALSTETGNVEISWGIDEGADTFEIRWVELGGPPVIPPGSKGFGSTVINQMTKSVLDADVRLDFKPEGIYWHLVCNSSALESTN